MSQPPKDVNVLVSPQPHCPGERILLTMSNWAFVSSWALSMGILSCAVVCWKRFSTASLICPSSRVFWVAVLWMWLQQDSWGTEGAPGHCPESFCTPQARARGTQESWLCTFPMQSCCFLGI